MQQGDGDLGARLQRVMSRAVANGSAALALAGDSAGVPPDRLEPAHAPLAKADAVIPANEGGGFYLLDSPGCRQKCSTASPGCTPQADASMRRIAAAGLRLVCLEPWFDIDRLEDLSKLRRLLSSVIIHAPATARLLQKPRP